MAGFPLAGTYRTPDGVTTNVMERLGARLGRLDRPRRHLRRRRRERRRPGPLHRHQQGHRQAHRRPRRPPLRRPRRPHRPLRAVRRHRPGPRRDVRRQRLAGGQPLQLPLPSQYGASSVLPHEHCGPRLALFADGQIAAQEQRPTRYEPHGRHRAATSGATSFWMRAQCWSGSGRRPSITLCGSAPSGRIQGRRSVSNTVGQAAQALGCVPAAPGVEAHVDAGARVDARATHSPDKQPPIASRGGRRLASRCASAARPSTRRPPLSPSLSPRGWRPESPVQHCGETERAREDSNL